MTPESLGYLLHRLFHAGVKTAMRTRYPMRASGIVVLVAAALLGGCAVPVKSFEPLVDKQHVVSDPEIIGKWVPQGDDSGAFEIEVQSTDSEAKTYKVTLSSAAGKSDYRARVGRWDKLEFADVESASAGQALDPVLAHSFWRIQHEGDFLWLAYMDSNWAAKQIPREKWRKSESWSDRLVFIGSTEELQAFVLSPVYDRNEWIESCFARKGTPSSSIQSLKLEYMHSGDLYDKERRYEEGVVAWTRYVELEPKDPDGHSKLAIALQSLKLEYMHSADLYDKERRYEEGVVAWTRYVELEPKDPDGHSKLAIALLGTNNPGQAREEFLEATRLGGCLKRDNEAYEWCKGTNQGERHLSFGVTYFAGDQYKQASREFHKALPFVNGSWEEPLLWDFLALRGSGKEGGARKLLKQAAKKPNDFFSKSAVADYFRGKISGEELAEASKKKNTPCEAYFVLGSEALIAGDKAAARQSFEKAARENDCSPLMAAATSARLKQLGAK